MLCLCKITKIEFLKKFVKKRLAKKFNNNFKNPICQISDKSSEFLVELKD